jgi:hypothetical protein
VKLIFCPECHDVRKLHRNGVTCWCGKSSGRYLEDDLHAEIAGKAIPLGIDNNTFAAAVRSRIQTPNGTRDDLDFTAFVIPADSPRVKVKSTDPFEDDPDYNWQA